jgi:hypothetical protein
MKKRQQQLQHWAGGSGGQATEHVLWWARFPGGTVLNL